MKRISAIFIVLIIFISQSAHTQYNSAISQYSYDIPDSTWKVDFHAAPYLPFVSSNVIPPRLQFGFEYHDKNHLGINVEFGYGDAYIYELNNSNRGSEGYQFFEIRPEIKFYAGPNDQMTRAYVAAELFGIFQKDIVKESYYYSLETPLIVRFDRADRERITAGLHLKAGFKVLAITHFSIDVFGGLGFSVRNTNYFNMLDPEASATFMNQFSYFRASLYPGTDIRLSGTLGIKFGYYVEGH